MERNPGFYWIYHILYCPLPSPADINRFLEWPAITSDYHISHQSGYTHCFCPNLMIPIYCTLQGCKLYFLEHVRGEGLMYLLQTVLNVLWPHVCDGCSFTKVTWRSIDEAGFSQVDQRKFTAPMPLLYLPLSPQIVGTATK